VPGIVARLREHREIVLRVLALEPLQELHDVRELFGEAPDDEHRVFVLLDELIEVLA
jgi:hypothetical protein